MTPNDKPLTCCLSRLHYDHLLAQAEQIAEAINANAGRFATAERWTAENVLVVALRNGLDEMEKRYCKK